MNRFKKWIEYIFCKHSNRELLVWNLHFFSESSVQKVFTAKYLCKDCGRKIPRHYLPLDKKDWEILTEHFYERNEDKSLNPQNVKLYFSKGGATR